MMFNKFLWPITTVVRTLLCCLIATLIARNASYVHSCFCRITTQAHPNKVVVVPILVVHHIAWSTAGAGPSKHVGGPMGTVDSIVVVAVVHNISGASIRGGPSKRMDRFIGRAVRSM